VDQPGRLELKLSQSMLTERTNKLILGAEARVLAVPPAMWLTGFRLSRGACAYQV
jgi:hypothetical protein